MKRLFCLLLFASLFMVAPEPSKANVVAARFDPPPILTWYCGVFDWSGGGGLPAGTYQVLSDLYGSHTDVLYIYDSYNNVSYECTGSTYDPIAGTANLIVKTPSGYSFIGTVSVY